MKWRSSGWTAAIQPWPSDSLPPLARERAPSGRHHAHHAVGVGLPDRLREAFHQGLEAFVAGGQRGLGAAHFFRPPAAARGAVGAGGKARQAAQQARVLGVETACGVVAGHPDRAERLAAHVPGREQHLGDRRVMEEHGTAAAGLAQQHHLAARHRLAARAACARQAQAGRACQQAGRRGPVEGLAIRRRHGDAGRSGAAQPAQQFGQALRYAFRRARQLLRQGAEGAALGRVVGRARRADLQLVCDKKRIDIEHCHRLLMLTIAHRDIFYRVICGTVRLGQNAAPRQQGSARHDGAAPAAHPFRLHSVPRFRASVVLRVHPSPPWPIVQAPDTPFKKKNMRPILKPALLAAAIAAGFLATQASHAESPGQPVTQQRQLAAFSAIELSGPYDVVVRAQGRQAVELSGDPKLLDEIETVVRGDTLLVRPVQRMGFNFSWGKRRDTVTIAITASQLKSLRMSGSGDVDLSQLSGERFSVAVDGPGDLQAAGAVRELSVRASGSGDADLHRVKAANVELAMSGPGDVRLSAVGNALSATLSGSGDLEADELRLARLSARLSGPGGMKLAGRARELRADVSGSGDFDACALAVEAASTTQRGPGNACVAGTITKFDAEVSGSGELQASGLRAPKATVRLSGPGNASLSGEIGELTAELSGSGDLEAGDLIVSRALLKARGPGGIDLASVSDTLDADLRGSGGLDARMDGKRLLLRMSGPGSAHVEGKVHLVKAQLSGSGGLDGRRLHAGRAEIAVSGPGNAVVNVPGRGERQAGRRARHDGDEHTRLLTVDRSGSRHGAP